VICPLPFFSELHILKGFKSCVLKLRILQGLRVRFAEVQMVKGLGRLEERQLKIERLELKGQRSGELNTEAQRAQRLGEDRTAVDTTGKAGCRRVGRALRGSG
jgi:hypothetical protein